MAERSSGRARKASQKVVESREAFLTLSTAAELPPAQRRKIKKDPSTSGSATAVSTGSSGTSNGKSSNSNSNGGGSGSGSGSGSYSDIQSSGLNVKYHIPAPIGQPVGQFIPSSVALSLLDKDAQISVSDDQMICTGVEGGFRMIRATHGVHMGPYYWECEILPPLCEGDEAVGVGLEPHVRVGFSTRFGELRGPVGYDKHSFAYRDVGGSKVHQRLREDNYGESFGVGDVIGCMIDLGVNETYSEIRFFKNGKDQGQAFGPAVGSVVPKGVYFPAISLFGIARVRANFGPTFIEPIDSSVFKVNSYCDLQPMNAREIAEHEKSINEIRQRRKKDCSSNQLPDPASATAPATELAAHDRSPSWTAPCGAQ